MVRISVIIPTRDRPDDVLRCLRALEDCTFELTGNAFLKEVILIDDASRTADLHPLTSSCDLPVHLLRNHTRLGANLSRQRGAIKATGDVLAFLDDDAVPRGDWLTIAASVTNECPAITGRVLPFDDGLISKSRQARYDARYSNLTEGQPVRFFAGGNGAVLADTFRAIGGFNGNSAGSDNSISEELHRLGTPVRFAPDLVIAHRHGKGWLRAINNSFRAGMNQHGRVGLRAALDLALSNAVGESWQIRLANCFLGAVHAAGRLAAKGISR